MLKYKIPQIVTLTPRHPVYIVVFAFCEKTKNPDSVWKSGFYCLFFFKVVPPGIEPFASVYSNSLSDCTFLLYLL